MVAQCLTRYNANSIWASPSVQQARPWGTRPRMLPNKSFFCYLRRQGTSSDMRKEELRLLLIYRGGDRGWKVKRSGEWKSRQLSTYHVKASAVVQDGLPLQLVKSVPGLFPSIPWRQPRLHDGPCVEYRMEETHPDPSIPPMICSQVVIC